LSRMELWGEVPIKGQKVSLSVVQRVHIHTKEVGKVESKRGVTSGNIRKGEKGKC